MKNNIENQKLINQNKILSKAEKTTNVILKKVLKYSIENMKIKNIEEDKKLNIQTRLASGCPEIGTHIITQSYFNKNAIIYKKLFKKLVIKCKKFL